MELTARQKNDLSFYTLVAGMMMTISSLMLTFLFSNYTDICIIDSILTENMTRLSNCKETLNIETGILYVGVVGILLLGFSSVVHVWERKSKE